MNSDTIIIIPSRLGSTRLKEKPLANIGEYSLIQRVVMQAQLTKIPVYVATDSDLIAKNIENLNAIPIMTDECSSGTDRVYQAYKKIQNPEIKYVINVQGDMPFIKPSTIKAVADNLVKQEFPIITPVAKVGIDSAKFLSNVKVIITNFNKALYFSRSVIPNGADKFWYHVGVYGFEVGALERFVALPRSEMEIAENLEQLRALDNGIDIGVCYVDDIPISVDTNEDLQKAIDYLK
jgi:3-deoxy-manno-octulosonate cytidylyltransferase (CMP-KDO synthetase)